MANAMPGISAALIRFYVEVGATMLFVPGQVDYAENPNPGDAAQQQGMGGQNSQSQSPMSPQGIAVNTQGLPVHPTYDRLAELAENGKLGRGELVIEEDVVLPVTSAGVTAAVAANTGVVTLAGDGGLDPDSDEFSLGMILRIGADDVVLADLPGSGANVNKFIAYDVATRKPPAQAIAAGVYSILNNQKLRRGPFSFRVASADVWSVPATGPMTSNIAISPTAILPKWAKAA